MSAYVITIMDNPQSIQAAARCIASGQLQPNKVHIKHHHAFTPKDNLTDLLERNGIKNLENFKNDQRYSRLDRCIAAFLSHLYCWKQCIIDNEFTLIFEHDAIMIGNLPEKLWFDKIITLAKPSYGKFNIPTKLGVGPMVQAQYTKGAHGYMISPEGAKELLEKAKTDAGPTDTFLNLNNFPFLQEYYPWIIEARDTFTTIQNQQGCAAKHNYNEQYKII